MTCFSRILCHASTGKPPLIEAPASLPAKNNPAAFRPRDFSCCVRVFQNFSSSVHEARSGRYHGPGFGVPGASGAAFTSRETDYGMPDAAPDSGPPMFMCVVTTLLPAERLPLVLTPAGKHPLQGDAPGPYGRPGFRPSPGHNSSLTGISGDLERDSCFSPQARALSTPSLPPGFRPSRRALSPSQ